MSLTERVETISPPFGKNDCAKYVRSASAKPVPEGWELHENVFSAGGPAQTPVPTCDTTWAKLPGKDICEKPMFLVLNSSHPLAS